MIAHSRTLGSRLLHAVLLAAIAIGIGLELFGGSAAYAADQKSGWVNDTDAKIAYSGNDWSYSPNRGAGDYQDDVHATATTGAWVSYTFTGTGVQLITELSADQGDMDVYLDGVFEQTVSTASSNNNVPQQVPVSLLWRTQGQHTIKLVKRSGTWMTVDAFAMLTAGTTVNDTDPKLSYSGNWIYSANRGVKDYSDDVHATTANGDSLSYTFSGSGCSFITEKSADQGGVDVYIDGQFKGTVDTHTTANNVPQQQVYMTLWNGTGQHTVKLVKNGGTWMTVDALVLIGAPEPTPPPAPDGRIWDVKVIRSTTDCGAGWERVDQDLNEGAGGDTVYLCVNHTQGSQSQPITGLMVCGRDNCADGWTQIKEPSLNAGATHTSLPLATEVPLYLYTKRGTNDPIGQIKMITKDGAITNLDVSCKETYGQDWVPMIGPEMNQDAGGKYIYGCLKLVPATATPPSVIWDLLVTQSSTPTNCPAGYIKDGLNLNTDAGGDYLYLCIDYTNVKKYTNPIHDLTLIADGLNRTDDLNCSADGSFRINVDLNSGAGGDYIYFCYSRQITPYTTPSDQRLVGVKFASRDSAEDPDTACTTDFGGHYKAVKIHNTFNGHYDSGYDLNSGAGGKYIYACQAHE